MTPARLLRTFVVFREADVLVFRSFFIRSARPGLVAGSAPGFPSGDRFLTRALFLITGLGAAAIAGYVLLSGVDLKTLLASSAAPTGPAESMPEHDQIDEKSRERLRAILREADAAPGQ